VCVCVCVCVCVWRNKHTHTKTRQRVLRVCVPRLFLQNKPTTSSWGEEERGADGSAFQKHTGEHTRIQVLERVGHPVVVVRVIFHDDDVRGKSIWAWVRASERVWDPRVCAHSRHCHAHLPSATRQMHHGHTDGCMVRVRGPHATIEWGLQWRV
jgi:hypothetical protein